MAAHPRNAQGRQIDVMDRGNAPFESGKRVEQAFCALKQDDLCPQVVKKYQNKKATSPLFVAFGTLVADFPTSVVQAVFASRTLVP